MKENLVKLMQGENLSHYEINQLANAMFNGELTNSQLSAILIGLAMKGETVEEKVRYLSKLEDEDDGLYLKVGERLALAVTLLLTSPNISKEEIDELQKEVA